MKRWSPAELNRLYRYALALSHAADEAGDLVQQALLRWLESDTRNIAEPLAYVMRMVRNLYYDRERHRHHREEVAAQLGEVLHLDFEPLEKLMIRREEVERLLAHLGADERELLYLWAVEGYTMDEIGKITETPRGTLLSRLHRLRRKLTSDDTGVVAAQ